MRRCKKGLTMTRSEEHTTEVTWQQQQQQQLENKMELQINSLETRIEKMQEMFNKDLEKLKRVNI